MSQISFKKIAEDKIQPKEFYFNKENMLLAKKILKIYPKNYKESSIMPLLSIAQNQNNGWLPKKAIEYVSSFLEIPEIKVLEIATFYSMYNLSPVGKFHIEVCTTSPCMLRGSDDILSFCQKKLAVQIGGISKDKMFSLSRVECLGACVNAPVVKINQDYYEDLDLNTTDKLINNITNEKKLKIGSQSGRRGSEPRKSSYDKKR
ncbi:MAG: NADH-quinone oxidoreductase subunit NuoE [Rickettsiales bacterium]|nr:NADH-quinone oxidoreductase subunit NuoE [Rickettsiales bacterium]|tara:strand:+ start:121 stop:732 length:612 start_codon:yes stop_codon:yes gene_type:complete